MCMYVCGGLNADVALMKEYKSAVLLPHLLGCTTYIHMDIFIWFIFTFIVTLIVFTIVSLFSIDVM